MIHDIFTSFKRILFKMKHIYCFIKILIKDLHNRILEISKESFDVTTYYQSLIDRFRLDQNPPSSPSFLSSLNTCTLSPFSLITHLVEMTYQIGKSFCKRNRSITVADFGTLIDFSLKSSKATRVPNFPNRSLGTLKHSIIHVIVILNTLLQIQLLIESVYLFY